VNKQQHQARENIIHAAAIRAALCAARGLAESQACHPPGCEHCIPPVRECQMCGATDPAQRAVCEQLRPGVCEWVECDTEGGSHD
jgi:hypothetical protein